MSVETASNSESDGRQLQKRHGSMVANPAPVGLFSFAATIFLSSMYNVSARGIHTSSVVIGMAVFVGGFLQFMAGMWEFPRGNTLGATVFSSYGAFWMSYATILIPGSGVVAAYGTDTQEFANALGLYLITWFIFTTILIPTVLFRNFAFTLLLTSVSITLIVLAAAEFTNKASLTKGGGVVGIIAAFIAYYIAISGLLAAEEKPIVKLPLGVR